MFHFFVIQFFSRESPQFFQKISAIGCRICGLPNIDVRNHFPQFNQHPGWVERSQVRRESVLLPNLAAVNSLHL